jgi:hypothetical protein
MFIGYFPQEWILFLSIGAICAALLGVLLGMRHDLKSFKVLTALLAVILSLIASSIAFDFHYLHEFADNGETYPRPLYGCSDLQRYLETVPAFRNPSPSTWKDLVEQSECRSGAIATVLVSSVLVWGNIFLLSVFFCLMLRFGLNRVRTPEKQDVITHNSSTAPPSTDIYQDIPFEYTIASLDKDAKELVDRICHHISASKSGQLAGWDGYVFLDFVWSKLNSEQKEVFKGGLKTKGDDTSRKVNMTWTSFTGLKGRGIAPDRTKEILEWNAICTKRPLRTLLEEFVIYYEKKGKNPELFKDIAPISEKLKSGLK